MKQDFLGATEGLIDHMFNVNVRAPLDLIRKTTPHMAKSGGGSIILVTSAAGSVPGWVSVNLLKS